MPDGQHSGQPTGPHPQLPDYRPRGMSKWDKIMAWTLVFIVVLFTLGMINRIFASKTDTMSSNPPMATATATPHASAAPTPTTTVRYVVINTTNGYIWWLDNTGTPFTKYTADQFIVGHSTYKVETLKAS